MSSECNRDEIQEPFRYRPDSDEPPSEAVVTAVATASNRDAVVGDATGEVDATTLDPLYEWIDPDALDALFRPAGERERTGTTTFTYCSYTVTVESTGLVTVTEG